MWIEFVRELLRNFELSAIREVLTWLSSDEFGMYIEWLEKVLNYLDPNAIKVLDVKTLDAEVSVQAFDVVKLARMLRLILKLLS